MSSGAQTGGRLMQGRPPATSSIVVGTSARSRAGGARPAGLDGYTPRRGSWHGDAADDRSLRRVTWLRPGPGTRRHL